MIITNNPSKCKLNQATYNKIVDGIDLDSIVCDSCSNHDWVSHATYERKIDIFNRKYMLIITRVICLHCRKTHAILVEDIVPFSILSHSEIIQVLSSYNTLGIFSSHLSFLKSKFLDHNFMSYKDICLLNSKGYSLIFAFST